MFKSLDFSKDSKIAMLARFLVPLIFALLETLSAAGQNAIARVYSDPSHNVHVAMENGKTVRLLPERDQVGISEPKITDDRETAGWLVLYKNPDQGSPVAGHLILWRGGHVLRRFHTQQTFWSWSFVHDGERVAYHLGPAHGETASHCELRDIRTGRLLASWDGDLDNADRPEWTKNLDH